MRSNLLRVILLIILGTSSISPAIAWEEGDRQAYNNKMAMLKVMLEGARQRAFQKGDLQTLCLIMSIGNDVTARYLALNPSSKEIQKRLKGMRNDLTGCFALMYNDIVR